MAISLTVISETHSSSSGDSVGSSSPEPGALVPVTGIVKVVNRDEVDVGNVGEAVDIKQGTVTWNKLE